VGWDQVLSWRMERQFLVPRGARSVPEVVGRLCGVQAQVASCAELAVAVRQVVPQLGAVDESLADRSVVKTWAMRGTLHLLVPAEAGAYLALLGDLRSWERSSWQRNFGVTSDDMVALIDAAADALDGRVLTRDELVGELISRTGGHHLEHQLRSGWGAVLKPLAWMGLLCQGPVQGGRVTFTRPDTWVADWPALPAVSDAAAVVIRSYLQVYGPATSEAFDSWLTRGATSKPKLRAWFAALEDELVEVDIEGDVGYVLAGDVDQLAATEPAAVVRLLPGFDQYLLGPGTRDTHIVAASRRSQISKAAGWISPVVIAGGRVVGVWSVVDGTLEIGLFDEAGTIARKALEDEAERINRFLGRALVVKAVSC